MANPATRFHLWVYKERPDVNAIVHTHSPWVSALVAARQPLVIAQMDMTPFHDDCAFLADWPGVPIARSEEHTSELQSLMRNTYACFRLKKKNNKIYTLKQ